ncbi:MAG: conjugal transfer protein TraD [Bacteroidetes bacterium 43-16]|nr:MAG: conjugal transfer protein TraD [Bacteroidetes bacterium 43-16]
MELLILICLLLIIFLLLQEKIVIKKRSDQNPIREKVNPHLPDIMGQPKSIPRLQVPNTANESQVEEPEIDPDTLDIEYDENEIVGIQIPEDELDEVFSNMPDFENEEEDWELSADPDDDFGFAQGVTFDELANVKNLLRKEKLEQSQKLEAIEIVQKIQGTELFYLLENSIEGASRKIAQLLDSTLDGSADSGITPMQKDDLSDFDIGAFV